MAVSGPKLAILSPQNNFEVPPITTAPPAATQPSGAERPEVADTIVTTQNQNRVGLQPVQVTGRVSDQGMPEPVEVDSVTVQVDDGPLMKAGLKHVPVGSSQTVVDFDLSVAIPDIEGPHAITVIATDDNDLRATETVMVFVGPPFQIAPAAALAELIWPAPSTQLTPSLVSRWTLLIQQHLAPLAALLAKYGLILAGPRMVLDQDTNVLRIGLWLGDLAFPAVPAAASGPPLPNLSDTQAAVCFAVTPNVLVPGSGAFAVSIPTTTLHNLLDAAWPTIVTVAARHDLTLETFNVTTTPPNIVSTTMSGWLPADTPVGVSFTETLGTEVRAPGSRVPTILHSQGSSSVGSIFEWIVGAICPIIGGLLTYASIDLGSAVAGDANKVTGIVAPLVAQIPYSIPFHNTDISASNALKCFPVLDVSWTSFVATDTEITGTGVLSIENRQQSDVSLSIQGPTKGPITPGAHQLEYTWVLANLDPDSITWTLTGDGQAQGVIVTGPFTQSGTFMVPFPDLTVGKTYQFTLSVSASETCGNNPANVPPLTAAWSSPISFTARTPNPH
jgi:hypothetical protein